MTIFSNLEDLMKMRLTTKKQNLNLHMIKRIVYLMDTENMKVKIVESHNHHLQIIASTHNRREEKEAEAEEKITEEELLLTNLLIVIIVTNRGKLEDKLLAVIRDRKAMKETDIDLIMEGEMVSAETDPSLLRNKFKNFEKQSTLSLKDFRTLKWTLKSFFAITKTKIIKEDDHNEYVYISTLFMRVIYNYYY